MVPVKNLGQLRWYSRRFYDRDWEKGTLKISQQTFAEQLADEYGIEYGRSVPLSIGTKLADFDKNEASGNWPFRELIGSLMWLSTQTRPDISNAVRAVARYCAAPKYVHWKAALSILGMFKIGVGGMHILFGLVASMASLFGAAALTSKPDVIDLPTGFFPGGITLGEGWTVYVGSNSDGSIWKGDLLTGEGEVVLAGPGAPELASYVKQTSYLFTSGVSGVVPNAPGLDHDRRSGYLFVAGGYSGIRIYDDENFDIVAEYDFDGVNGVSFVGDVIVTRTAAYFTDSVTLKIYMIELNPYDGGLTNGPHAAVETIRLSWEVSQSGEGIDINGIEATDDGKMLIVSHTTKCQLFSVDLVSGDTTLIDLGDGHVVFPDGMVVRRNTLWVVENGDWGGPEQITEIALSPDLTCAHVMPRAMKSDLFNNPTKMLRKGNAFYAVNAKFEELAQKRTTRSYEIIRVDRDSGEYDCEDE
eukprot:jgi/Undpi1/267/HiC_scaffold_1.g00263.m1